jgi:hypothetical protein
VCCPSFLVLPFLGSQASAKMTICPSLLVLPAVPGAAIPGLARKMTVCPSLLVLPVVPGAARRSWCYLPFLVLPVVLVLPFLGLLESR